MLELREYDLLGNLDNEEDMLTDFENSYADTEMYIADAINEHADSYIPIYYNDIWKNARYIQEWIEEAVFQGLVNVSGKDFDLIRMFHYGYYEFYTASLYRNLDTIMFNIVAKKVNEHLEKLNEKELSKIDIEAIESKIEELTTNYNNNNKFTDVEEISNDLVVNIENGEFIIE